VAALRRALETRRARGCIHHSDRGVQYASAAYVSLLRQHGLQISMSAKGNPYDNAFMESFYKTLKYEEVHLWNYETYDDVIERLPFFWKKSITGSAFILRSAMSRQPSLKPLLKQHETR
jgi:putative transposase